MQEIIECIPNFSEGRDLKIIQTITDAIQSVSGIKLLNVDPGVDTNRTVMTFIGSKSGVLEAAFAGIAKAAEVIDMRKHHGAHARLGATDVCPFVPISGVTEEECIELTKKLAKRVADELNIPVYLYEKSAQKPERTNLAAIREGEYEGLAEKLKNPEWKPDFGKPEFNVKSGATVIGVRDFLIAYNVNLNTRDAKLANDIALTIREKGRAKRDANGKIVKDANGETIYIPGVFKSVKAVGWYLEQYRLAQVSINLTNYAIAPPHEVFDEICRLAAEKGLRVTGSELVGLIPKEAMLIAGRHYLRLQGKSEGVPTAELIRVAVQSMGMNEITPFDPQKKIIEFQVREFEKALVDLSVRDFIDELSMDSPAPGGGSVSALCGALASGLISMVANLTYGKKGYERFNHRMNEIAGQAQELKDELLRLIDLDTTAFNRVMACYRMTKKSDDEKYARSIAIEEAMKQATLVPLEVIKTTQKTIRLMDFIVKHGNINSISDAGVSALCAETAVKGAAMNVRINLGSVTDEAFRSSIKSEVDDIEKETTRIVRRLVRSVNRKIGGNRSL
ncbi:MAG: glutamate formimidoyltransferase [Candidatus Marinimicrobia bacterium]|nr:glutamate formimidoyltransferase [Candidatus Neomarinimicrobiota bacterium]